jgi:hypothetical protein
LKSEHKDISISIDEDKDGKKVKKIIIETEKEERKKRISKKSYPIG